MNATSDKTHGALVANTRFHAAPYWILISAGFLFVYLVFDPGYLTVDGTFQYLQAKLWGFEDWHTPIMGWVWRGIDKLIPGTRGIFLFQLLLFWGGLAGVVEATFGPRWQNALIALAIAVFPPILGMEGAIWKDIHFGGAMLCSVALLLHSMKSEGRLALWVVNLPLLYAGMLRHNSLPALLPLFLLYGYLLGQRLRPTRGLRWRMALGVSLLVVHLASAALITKAVLRPKIRYPAQQVMIHDIAAISLARGSLAFPPYLEARGLTLDRVRSLFDRDSVTRLIFTRDAELTTESKAEFRQLQRTWLRLLAQEPLTYLKHRLTVFGCLLGVGDGPVVEPFHANQLAPHLAHHRKRLGVPEYHPNQVNRFVNSCLESLRGTFLFRGWFYLLALLAALALAVWRLRWRAIPTCVVGTSALFYVLAYLPAAPSAEFRYLWWAVIAPLIMIPIALASREQGALLGRSGWAARQEAAQVARMGLPLDAGAGNRAT